MRTLRPACFSRWWYKRQHHAETFPSWPRSAPSKQSFTMHKSHLILVLSGRLWFGSLRHAPRNGHKCIIQCVLHTCRDLSMPSLWHGNRWREEEKVNDRCTSSGQRRLPGGSWQRELRLVRNARRRCDRTGWVRLMAPVLSSLCQPRSEVSLAYRGPSSANKLARDQDLRARNNTELTREVRCCLGEDRGSTVGKNLSLNTAIWTWPVGVIGPDGTCRHAHLMMSSVAARVGDAG